MKRILKTIFATAGIGSSLYCLWQFGNWQTFSVPSPMLLFTLLGLFSIEVIARTERIRRTSHLTSRPISFAQALWVNALGDIFGAITPSGVGGEVSRLAGFVRLGIRTKEGLAAFAAERFALLCAMGIVVFALSSVVIWRDPHTLGLPSFRYTVMIYVGGLGCAAAIAWVLIRRKTAALPWRSYLWKPDLIALAMVHHLVRIGLLPIVFFALTGHVAPPLVWVWSLVLCYGLSLLPVPSGGGAIEFAFKTGLAPFLGPLTSEALVIWRINDFYLYVITGAFTILITSLASRRNAVANAPTCSSQSEPQ